MLEFLLSVMGGGIFWAVVGSFIAHMFREGSKGRENFSGLAAFGAFCFLAAFGGSILYLIWITVIR